MPKINQEEYEVLKGMGSGWKWLARESNGNLYKHSEKPMKLPTRLDETQTWLKMDGSRFLFIKSTDEPYSIAELIEEYEENLANEIINRQFESLFGESEETEVKNIEELKSWFEDDKLYVGEYVKHKINQLDEPEVLSPEWIDEHKFNIDTYDEVINVDDLQNLLVPKQELPVIPNYVAKWISKHHERFDLYPALKRLENNALSWEDVYEWYRRNTYIFVNAYLTGKYEVEVEEQPQYIIKTGDERYLSQLALNYVNNPPVTTVHHMKEMAIRFSDRELAQKVADLVNNGEVEELEE